MKKTTASKTVSPTTDIPYDQLSSRFNRLPSIESADLQLKSGQKLQTAFAVLAPVFVKHGVCDHWGIGLLHKHWPLHDGEIPVQIRVRWRGGFEWISEPRTRNFDITSWTSVLSVGLDPDGSLEPLEFSTDPSVQSANGILVNRPEFRNEFCATMRAYSLEKIFGLIALREPSEPGGRLREFNYKERISIVREVVARDFDSDNVIETCWRFKPAVNMGDCLVSCFSDCQATGDGGHRKYHVHNHYSK